MTTRPDDYIDVTTIDTEEFSVTKHVKITIRRFYDQEFSVRHVWGVLKDMEEFEEREKLYDAVRAAVHSLKKRKKIKFMQVLPKHSGRPYTYVNVST